MVGLLSGGWQADRPSSRKATRFALPPLEEVGEEGSQKKLLQVAGQQKAEEEEEASKSRGPGSKKRVSIMGGPANNATVDDDQSTGITSKVGREGGL